MKGYEENMGILNELYDGRIEIKIEQYSGTGNIIGRS